MRGCGQEERKRSLCAVNRDNGNCEVVRVGVKRIIMGVKELGLEFKIDLGTQINESSNLESTFFYVLVTCQTQGIPDQICTQTTLFC